MSEMGDMKFTTAGDMMGNEDLVKITWYKDGTTVELEWHNTALDIVESYSGTVARDIVKLECDKAEDLIFHHVFLTQDSEGPSVFVWGKEGSDSYQCEYSEKTTWGDSPV